MVLVGSSRFCCCSLTMGERERDGGRGGGEVSDGRTCQKYWWDSLRWERTFFWTHWMVVEIFFLYIDVGSACLKVAADPLMGFGGVNNYFF